MPTFESVHGDAITGKLVMFDRLLFKGYLGLMGGAAFERLLNAQHVLLKDFGAYCEKTTKMVKDRVAEVAREAGRPMEYLATAMTANNGRSKEDLAREIAERDGVKEGLIVVLSALEGCQSFDVRWHPKLKRLAAVRRPRKCLHDYFYFIDREFGFKVVTSDKYRRPEGRRVKHRVRRNSIKMYDKYSVLRVETTINNPSDFRVLKTTDTEHGQSLRWVPMNKGVSNLWRYRQVGEGANGRYLEAMASVTLKGEAVQELDRLCRSHTVDGRRIARLEPISDETCCLFQAILRGEHHVRGFRNRDLAAVLHPKPPASPREKRRLCERISRQVSKLRGHGLVAKVPRSHRYRATAKGVRLMSAAIRVRLHDFPRELRAA